MSPMGKLVPSALFCLLVPLCFASSGMTSGDSAFTCAELPFNSFPPNQLLREETKEGGAFSVLKAEKSGAWCEFFIQIDNSGTYRLAVTSPRAPDEGICQIIVNGDPVGAPLDLYAPAAGSEITRTVGCVTFLKPGNYSFRFLVTGKNAAASGYDVAQRSLSLEPIKGFTLLSPNGACEFGSDVLLRWNAWPEATHYRVKMDGVMTTEVNAPTTNCRSSNVPPGLHRWQIVALGAGGKAWDSNTLSFFVGVPPPYHFREFNDDFSTGELAGWSLTGMKFGRDAQGGGLNASGVSSALAKDVRLDKAEGEISARITPVNSEAVGGVGFQAEDGTRLYAILDGKRGQFRVERRVKGYSIFDVTPKGYQVKGWAERPEGEAMVWEIAARPATFHPGISYEVKLAFSRRSTCVMATLLPSDGSPRVIIRELCDLRTPDHPLLICLDGQTRFASVTFRRLNKQVYNWDPDSYRIVVRPGEAGSWDAKGALNPAVMARDGKWYMVYRGNAVPAPPNGHASSELGLATSMDGIHWTKSASNPIIPRQGPKDSQEDPDFLWVKDKQEVYLEYVTHLPKRHEVMRSSPDWIHWSEPWSLEAGGKIGALLDLRDGAAGPGVSFQGVTYPYLAMVEEGAIYLSQDLHTLVKEGVADLEGRADWWCDYHECSGDMFVDADHNIRYEAQAGVSHSIVGNRLCTLVEGVLSGADPTKVLWRSDLPWLPDWYGNAPTGSPEDFTASNGSVFPGQTIIKDNWLWHFSGGNNTFAVLSKCWYGPVFEYRNLVATVDPTHQCSVSVVVRNTGSIKGSGKATLTLDGNPALRSEVTLERDTEKTLHWTVPMAEGIHTVSVEDVSETVEVGK